MNRPIKIGRTTYAVDHPRDHKGRPAKRLAAYDAQGEEVATAHTRFELERELAQLHGVEL